MPVRYTRVGWQDAPSTDTPIDAANLNHMDNGILALSEEVDTELPLLQGQINDISTDIDTQIDEKVPPEVSSWLTEHVTPAGSAVVVDDSLTIQGAAADAKKTGDEISSLKEDFDDISSGLTGDTSGYINVYKKNANENGVYWEYTGAKTTSYASDWCVTAYIPVIPGNTYIYEGLTATGSAPHTVYVDAEYTFVKAYKQLTGRNSIIAPTGASYISFSIKISEASTFKFYAPVEFASKSDMYQLIDRRPTYVILDFDGDILTLSDNRVSMVNEEYGFPFSFVGISVPAVTKELIKRGCDLSIYSNASGLPPTSTINSTSEADIQAWDDYVNEALTRYNSAGFYNQVCWSCQGNNYGSALATALHKYGFKMARGNEVGGSSSIYIDGFDDNSYRVGCFQIYTGREKLTLQQVTNAVNNAKDIVIFTHKIVDTADEDRGYDCTKATYKAFLDGVKTKVAAGQVKVVTFREYYKMHCPKSNYEYDYNRIFKTIWQNN